MRTAVPRGDMISGLATMLLRVVMDAGSATPFERTVALRRVFCMSAVANGRNGRRMTKEELQALNDKVEGAVSAAVKEALKELPDAAS